MIDWLIDLWYIVALWLADWLNWILNGLTGGYIYQQLNTDWLIDWLITVGLFKWWLIDWLVDLIGALTSIKDQFIHSYVDHCGGLFKCDWLIDN